MPSGLRCHAPLCVAFESLSIAGERRGSGASWGRALTLGRGLRASFVLIQELGLEVDPKTKRSIQRRPTWAVAAMLWSPVYTAAVRGMVPPG